MNAADIIELIIQDIECLLLDHPKAKEKLRKEVERALSKRTKKTVKKTKSGGVEKTLKSRPKK